ncbi:hypothetical protein CPAR01_14633 [Colletotrichum paranaense]|uniref:Uncharacterized protein n=2 Tax=Colletotrichum acutatum species complex TaxID=2707335 RepID=A0AAI9U4U7_9PEZI|nr:uncharacterized protein CPAR01_14633 [Colletotrichum paranaense]KAK1451737.1 hypothetical protein CMEL01_06311 [Colletotrichum melonis]KAK1521716.1 hypothetical protein CPAR01_14633 [Colletotrichum paranaense]
MMTTMKMNGSLGAHFSLPLPQAFDAYYTWLGNRPVQTLLLASKAFTGRHFGVLECIVIVFLTAGFSIPDIVLVFLFVRSGQVGRVKKTRQLAVGIGLFSWGEMFLSEHRYKHT